MNPENTCILPPPDWAVELLSASPRKVAALPTAVPSPTPSYACWFKVTTDNGPLFGTICVLADVKTGLREAADAVESLIVRSLGQLERYVGDESPAPKVDLEKVERITTGAPPAAAAPPAEAPASDVPPAAPARRGRPKKAQPAPAPAEVQPETPAAPEPPKIFVPDGMSLQRVGASPDPIAPPQTPSPAPPASVPVPATAADPSVPKTGVDYGETIVCYGNRKGAKLSSVPRNIIEWYANEMLRKIALKDGRKPTAEEANLANAAAMYLEGGH